jgi:hypothetical protein
VRPPDVVIIGAQKAATTGLLATLAQHHRVRVPQAQEATVLHSGERWESWVRDREPHLARVDADEVVLVKLASAMYFEDTLRSIRQLNPAVKLIAVLRHPVDRMVSQYLYAVQHGLESRPMDEALGADVVQKDDEYRLRTYSAGSRYADAIGTIREFFDPAQVLYVDFATVSTPQTLAAIQEFIGIDPVVTEAIRANESRAPRSAAVARAERSTTLKTVGRTVVPARLRAPIRAALRSWNASPTAPEKPALPEGLRRGFVERHAPDTAAAEQVLGKELPAWRA